MTINELEDKIKKYQDSYYNGEAEVSDAAFDALWDELKKINPDSLLLKKVGADSTDGFEKGAHIMPMGSQEKAANAEEFAAWAAKIKPQQFVVQFKLDGASLELQYKNGILQKALTRGDGKIGDDITANARKMQGVVSDLKTPWSGAVRGEVLMFHDVWEKKYKTKANCRNAANGVMRRKIGEGCEDLTLIAYDLWEADDLQEADERQTQKIERLKKYGFKTTETRICSSVQEVIDYRNEIALKRSALDFDIDGLVVKNNDTDVEDLKRERPQTQIAFKFELEQAISTLLDVEWSESGATYTPIGIVEPVRLAGTTVKRANLCNPAMIRSMGLEIGSKVIVVKRGEIIPKIEGLCGNSPCGKKIDIPTTCSTCGSTLVDGGTELYCPNTACKKRLLHRLQKWAAVVDIMELGDKLILQLFEKGVCAISDLYKVTPAQLAEYERMGELSAAKVIKNIHSRRSLPLATFIAGFDFDGIGETIMEKVCEGGYGTLASLRGASVEDLSGIFGIGKERAQTLCTGLTETKDEMDELQKFVSIKAPHEFSETETDGKNLSLKGKSFCFTGELKTMKRSAAEQKVKLLGGSAKSSVTKDLTYLVTNDVGSGSSKNKKAAACGVAIISEEEFLDLIKGQSI
ncbi:MAG: NAD-dependent DNA ligase LigA [Termitinemataceae bacterium]|nr:MAG: NAD-dependent DNA ligase LigA [Termitinemataceae bacterium]